MGEGRSLLAAVLASLHRAALGPLARLEHVAGEVGELGDIPVTELDLDAVSNVRPVTA